LSAASPSVMRTRLARLRRRLAYLILRPKPPRHPTPLTGPVLVVGSAPDSHLPDGYGPGWSVFTINGSQTVTKSWGIAAPDVTFMQFNQVEGMNDNAVAVRRVLKGERTGLLYLVRWTKSFPRLKRGLAAFDYGYADLRRLSRYQRMALYAAVMGTNLVGNDDLKCSNGVTAVLYALYNGAPAVVISGIDPGSTGHVYNELGLVRRHADIDMETLRKLNADGFPIYTADPHVADSLGLRLWMGNDASRSDPHAPSV
jgi:hypothetical protein